MTAPPIDASPDGLPGRMADDHDLPAYIDGQWMPLSQVRISPMDRGFLFGDGVYELIPAYGGRAFRLPEHLARLRRSLGRIGIESPHDDASWTQRVEALLAQVPGAADPTAAASVYIQVTRGAAPRRDHAFPSGVTPTVFMFGNRFTPPDAVQRRQGLACVSTDDERWLRGDIKSVAILGNVLARQHAVTQGAAESILVRDGRVTEGATTNVFAVIDGVLVTPPASRLLLAGISRAVVLELARAHRMPVQEREISLAQLRMADELWLTSSTKDVMPVTRLDGVPVGSGAAQSQGTSLLERATRAASTYKPGEPGPFYWQMHTWFEAAKAAECGLPHRQGPSHE